MDFIAKKSINAKAKSLAEKFLKYEYSDCDISTDFNEGRVVVIKSGRLIGFVDVFITCHNPLVWHDHSGNEKLLNCNK